MFSLQSGSSSVPASADNTAAGLHGLKLFEAMLKRQRELLLPSKATLGNQPGYQINCNAPSTPRERQEMLKRRAENLETELRIGVILYSEMPFPLEYDYLSALHEHVIQISKKPTKLSAVDADKFHRIFTTVLAEISGSLKSAADTREELLRQDLRAVEGRAAALDLTIDSLQIENKTSRQQNKALKFQIVALKAQIETEAEVAKQAKTPSMEERERVADEVMNEILDKEKKSPPEEDMMDIDPESPDYFCGIE
jgi:hypothetical protein